MTGIKPLDSLMRYINNLLMIDKSKLPYFCMQIIHTKSLRKTQLKTNLIFNWVLSKRPSFLSLSLKTNAENQNKTSGGFFSWEFLCIHPPHRESLYYIVMNDTIQCVYILNDKCSCHFMFKLIYRRLNPNVSVELNWWPSWNNLLMMMMMKKKSSRKQMR